MTENSNITLDKLYITAANEASAKFNYGDMIKKSWLIEKFSIEFPRYGTQKDFDTANFEFLQNMESFKLHMLESHQMLLSSARGIGYVIIHPTSQSDHAMLKLKDAMASEIKKAVNILTHVNTDFLSQDDIRKRDEASGKIAAIAAFSRKRISFK
jgi:hypothetical protein